MELNKNYRVVLEAFRGLKEIKEILVQTILQ
jgi:hypothetical protein